MHKYTSPKSILFGALILTIALICIGCGFEEKGLVGSSEQKTLYLVKANNDLISHCKCETAFVTSPSQIDCPWCGCGWLFTCINCRKAFTFAKAAEVDLSWEELALRDLKNKWKKEPSDEEVYEWIEFMKILLKGIQPGKEYIYFDGWVFPSDRQGLRFEGWYSHHEFDILPHTEALKDRTFLDRTIGNKAYWQSRRVEQK